MDNWSFGREGREKGRNFEWDASLHLLVAVQVEWRRDEENP